MLESAKLAEDGWACLVRLERITPGRCRVDRSSGPEGQGPAEVTQPRGYDFGRPGAGQSAIPDSFANFLTAAAAS